MKIKVKHNYFLRSQGFTFIELLIVVFLMGLISVAIYNALSNGYRIWQRGLQIVTEENIVLFFDKFESHIQNVTPISNIEFKGSSSEFYFPTIVSVPADPKSLYKLGEYIEQVGQVRYSFDSLDKSIYLQVNNYSHSLKNDWGDKRVLASKIDDLKFRYFYITEDGEKVSDTTLDTFPSGVEAVVNFSDQYGEKTLRLYFNVPLSY